MTKLISFIIAYHNEPVWLLNECLKSIHALPLNDDEREIIVIHDEHSEGLSITRNRGIEQATGEYIQFIDCDDTLITQNYVRIINCLTEKQMDLLMFRFSHKPEAKSTNAAITGGKNGVEFLLHNNLRPAACAYVFRRKILHNLRFKAELLHEDNLFTPQLIMQAQSVYVLTEKAYFYRLQATSITHNPDASHLKKRMDDATTILRELRLEMAKTKGKTRQAYQRVIDQQTMSLLYTIHQSKMGWKEIRKRATILHKEGFMPLPLHAYTWKYLLFAIATRLL